MRARFHLAPIGRALLGPTLAGLLLAPSPPALASTLSINGHVTLGGIQIDDFGFIGSVGPLGPPNPIAAAGTITADGLVDYGLIRLEVHALVNEQVGGASASALFEDFVTVSAPASGTLTFAMNVTGTVDAAAAGVINPANILSDSFADAFYALDVFGAAPGTLSGATAAQRTMSQGVTLVSDGNASGGLVFYETPFTAGVPVPIAIGMTVGAVAAEVDTDAAFHSATADFGNSLTWAGLVSIVDLQGDPIDSFSLSSESGFDYLAAVPEPSRALLMASGLLFAAVWRSGARSRPPSR